MYVRIQDYFWNDLVRLWLGNHYTLRERFNERFLSIGRLAVLCEILESSSSSSRGSRHPPWATGPPLIDRVFHPRFPANNPSAVRCRCGVDHASKEALQIVKERKMGNFDSSWRLMDVTFFSFTLYVQGNVRRRIEFVNGWRDDAASIRTRNPEMEGMEGRKEHGRGIRRLFWQREMLQYSKNRYILYSTCQFFLFLRSEIEYFVFLPSLSKFFYLYYKGNRIEKRTNLLFSVLIVARFHFSFSLLVE